MNYKLLESMVNDGYSTRDIAGKVNKSQTTVRYWLNKYTLKTKPARVKPKDYVCIKCDVIGKEHFYGKKSTVCGKCHNKDTIVRQRATKAKGVDYLGGKCCKCGYNKYIGALDFHHVDPRKKDTKFGSSSSWGWERLKKELDGCTLLCANCHREEHRKQ